MAIEDAENQGQSVEQEPSSPYGGLNIDQLSTLSKLLAFFIMAAERQGRTRAILLFTLRKFLDDNFIAKDNAAKNAIQQAALDQDFKKVFKLFSDLETSLDNETAFATELENVLAAREKQLDFPSASSFNDKHRVGLTARERGLLIVCVIAALGVMATAWSVPELDEAKIDLGASVGATAAHVLTFCGALLLVVIGIVAYRKWQDQKAGQLPAQPSSSQTGRESSAKDHINILETLQLENFERQEGGLAVGLEQLSANADDFVGEAVAILQKGFELRPDLPRRIESIESRVAENGTDIIFEISWQDVEPKEQLAKNLEKLCCNLLKRFANQPDAEPKNNEAWIAIKNHLSLDSHWSPVTAAQARRQEIKTEKQEKLLAAIKPLLEVDTKNIKVTMVTAKNIEEIYSSLEGTKLPAGIKWHITEEGRVKVEAPEVSSENKELDEKIIELAEEVLNKTISPNVIDSFRQIDLAFTNDFCSKFNVAALEGATLKRIQDEKNAVSKINAALKTAGVTHNRVTKQEADKILQLLYDHHPKSFDIGYDDGAGRICISNCKLQKPVHHPALELAVESFIAAVLNRFWLDGASAASHGIDWSYLEKNWFSDSAVIKIDQKNIPAECRALAELDKLNSMNYGDVTDEKLNDVLVLLEALVSKIEVETGSNKIKSINFVENAIDFKENKTRIQAGVKTLINTVLNTERQVVDKPTKNNAGDNSVRAMYNAFTKTTKEAVDDYTKTRLSEAAANSFKVRLKITEVAPEQKNRFFA